METKQSQINTFSEGFNTDLHPTTTSNTIMTDCLNGTIVTYNGNEGQLQNDMGNYFLKGAQLPSDYVPIGIKEYGGILYIASHNPITGKSQIGTYPSPKIATFADNSIMPEEKDFAWYEVKTLERNISPEDIFKMYSNNTVQDVSSENRLMWYYRSSLPDGKAAEFDTVIRPGDEYLFNSKDAEIKKFNTHYTFQQAKFELINNDKKTTAELESSTDDMAIYEGINHGKLIVTPELFNLSETEVTSAITSPTLIGKYKGPYSIQIMHTGNNEHDWSTIHKIQMGTLVANTVISADGNSIFATFDSPYSTIYNVKYERETEDREMVFEDLTDYCIIAHPWVNTVHYDFTGSVQFTALWNNLTSDTIQFLENSNVEFSYPDSWNKLNKGVQKTISPLYTHDFYKNSISIDIYSNELHSGEVITVFEKICTYSGDTLLSTLYSESTGPKYKFIDYRRIPAETTRIEYTYIPAIKSGDSFMVFDDFIKTVAAVINQNYIEEELGLGVLHTYKYSIDAANTCISIETDSSFDNSYEYKLYKLDVVNSSLVPVNPIDGTFDQVTKTIKFYSEEFEDTRYNSDNVNVAKLASLNTDSVVQVEKPNTEALKPSFDVNTVISNRYRNQRKTADIYIFRIIKDNVLLVSEALIPAICLTQVKNNYANYSTIPFNEWVEDPVVCTNTIESTGDIISKCSYQKNMDPQIEVFDSSFPVVAFDDCIAETINDTLKLFEEKTINQSNIQATSEYIIDGISSSNTITCNVAPAKSVITLKAAEEEVVVGIPSFGIEQFRVLFPEEKYTISIDNINNSISADVLNTLVANGTGSVTSVISSIRNRKPIRVEKVSSKSKWGNNNYDERVQIKVWEDSKYVKYKGPVSYVDGDVGDNSLVKSLNLVTSTNFGYYTVEVGGYTECHVYKGEYPMYCYRCIHNGDSFLSVIRSLNDFSVELPSKIKENDEELHSLFLYLSTHLYNVKESVSGYKWEVENSDTISDIIIDAAITKKYTWKYKDIDINTLNIGSKECLLCSNKVIDMQKRYPVDINTWDSCFTIVNKYLLYNKRESDAITLLYSSDDIANSYAQNFHNILCIHDDKWHLGISKPRADIDKIQGGVYTREELKLLHKGVVKLSSEDNARQWAQLNDITTSSTDIAYRQDDYITIFNFKKSLYKDAYKCIPAEYIIMAMMKYQQNYISNETQSES